MRQTRRETFRNSVPEPEGSKALYLYCLADSALLPAITAVGINGRDPVFLLPCIDVVAVVSFVFAQELNGLADENATARVARVGRFACRHEEVVERAMLHSPVLPMRFGTLFDSVESLQKRLQKHHGAIRLFFHYVSGKDEWAVKAFLDPARTRRKHLKEAQGRLSSPNLPPSGTLYLRERQIRTRCEDSVDRQVEENCKSTGVELCRMACDFRVHKPAAWEMPEGGSEMIVNWAFLVSRDKAADFCTGIRRANDRCSISGLVFRVSGPWPPYSFCPSLDEEAQS